MTLPYIYMCVLHARVGYIHIPYKTYTVLPDYPSLVKLQFVVERLISITGNIVTPRRSARMLTMLSLCALCMIIYIELVGLLVRITMF